MTIIDKLKENPDNPRTISKEKFEKLKNNIAKFPKMLELRPIVYNKKNIVLGGNMRLKAIRELLAENKIKLKDSYFKKAESLTESEQQQFIVLDNQEFGDWDFDSLANLFNTDELLDWGFENKDFGIGAETSFPELASGDRDPFQQMTFILADKQAEVIKNAISEIKKTEDYKYAETMGNENSNGNALYLIVSEWEQRRK